MSEFKFYCPQCGQHILCDTGYRGQQINCPICQKTIVVPQPPASAPVPPQAAPVYTPLPSAAPAAGRPYPNTPVAQPAVPVRSRTLQTVFMVVIVVLVFAGLGVGGWFGYTQIKIRGQHRNLPPGLVGLWPGEGNGKDLAGGHDAEVSGGVTYSSAKIGTGFEVDGHTGQASVPASPPLDVGSGPGFSLTAWIAPASATVQEPLMEWRGSRGINQGVQFWISVNFGGVGGPGCIYANIVDAKGRSHFIASPPGMIQPGAFQYVALTYNKATGLGNMYFNGAQVASENLGSFSPKTDTPLMLGARVDSGEFHYQGIIDEPSLYNRALSAEEIQAIYLSQK